MVIVSPEIVGVEEEENAPTGLVSDGSFLFGGGGLSEKEGGTTPATRSDNHPAFVAARSVFDQFELKRICEEGNGFIIVADEVRDEDKSLFNDNSNGRKGQWLVSSSGLG